MTVIVALVLGHNCKGLDDSSLLVSDVTNEGLGMLCGNAKKTPSRQKYWPKHKRERPTHHVSKM